MAIPQWAQELTLKALIHCTVDDVPVIRWRRSQGQTSSGTCFRDKKLGFVVTAGRNRTDAKLVLLHELAHWLRPAGECHGDAFWDLAWNLYRWAKLPVRYCLSREKNYRKGAVLAYKRSK